MLKSQQLELTLNVNASTLNIDDNSTSLSSDGGVVERKLQLWALLLLTIPLATLFGNLLVVLSVAKERSLHNTTNLFIVSLAVADITLALLVMPLATLVEVRSGSWIFGQALCNTYLMFDALFCTASILNLVAISFDRYLAVSRPIAYAKHNNVRRVQISITLVWLFSLLIALPMVCGYNKPWHSNELVSAESTTDECVFYNPVFMIASSMLSFYLPAFLLLCMYQRIFALISRRSNGVGQQLSTDQSTTQFDRSLGSVLADVGHSIRSPQAINGIGHRHYIKENGTEVVQLTNRSSTTQPVNNGLTKSKDQPSDISSKNGRSIEASPNYRYSRDSIIKVTPISSPVLVNSFQAISSCSSSKPSISPSGSYSCCCCCSKDAEQCCPGCCYCNCTAVSQGSKSRKQEAVIENVSQHSQSSPQRQPSTFSNSFTSTPGSSSSLTSSCSLVLPTTSDGPSYLDKVRSRSNIIPISSAIRQLASIFATITGPFVGEDMKVTSNTTTTNGQRSSTTTTSDWTPVKGVTDRSTKWTKSRLTWIVRRNNASSGDSVADSKVKQLRRQKRLAQREKKVLKTLVIVLGAFLACWLPFFCVNVGIGWCMLVDQSDSFICTLATHHLIVPATWLGYVNSLLNPIIYTIFNLEFRTSFKKLLHLN